MNERYLRWWTPHLSRDFQMLVFGDGGGLPLVVYPTSFGNFHQCKDFQRTDACADFVERGRITPYCPDAIDLDSFHNKSIHPADRIKTHVAYENVILHDVIDFARREAGCHRVAVTGASLIGTGEWDNTRHEGLRLSALLNDKGINHWLDDRKWCGHDWNYWREMLPYYLSTL